MRWSHAASQSWAGGISRAWRAMTWFAMIWRRGGSGVGRQRPAHRRFGKNKTVPAKKWGADWEEVADTYDQLRREQDAYQSWDILSDLVEDWLVEQGAKGRDRSAATRPVLAPKTQQKPEFAEGLGLCGYYITQVHRYCSKTSDLGTGRGGAG